MLIKSAILVCLLSSLIVAVPVNETHVQALKEIDGKSLQETGRMSIMEEFERLTSGTKSLFSDVNTLRNSPVMQSLLSRITQRGSYMTQPAVEKKTDDKKNIFPVNKVQSAAAAKLVATAITPAPKQETKKSDVVLSDKTKVADDPSKYFKMGDMTIAGAMGLGALALGALIASPVVGAGILSRSDDDPGVTGKKSWLDSLAFWKDDQDSESFYEVPVVANNGYEQYYNPYHDLGDGTGYDPSIIKYQDDDDYYVDYNDEGTRLDKNSHKKSYYNYADHGGSRLDKTKKKKTYYSDADFWNDHYFKDGAIYERGSNLASPYSYDSASGGGYYNPKKKESKRPYSRVSYYDTGDYGAASEGYYEVQDGYSVNDYGSKSSQQNYQDEDDDTVYVTVDEINKIANDSLKDILKQYQQYLKRVDSGNVVYTDIGNEDFAEGSSRAKSEVYSGRVGAGSTSDWQPLEIYGDNSDWSSGDQYLRNHRIPSREIAREKSYDESSKRKVDKSTSTRTRSQKPKIQPSQADYPRSRYGSNKERHIYAAAQVQTTESTESTKQPPRKKLTRKTTTQETATPKSRLTRNSNILNAPSEKEAYPAEVLAREMTDYQKAYARRFKSN